MQLFILTPFNPKWPTSKFKKFEAIIVRATTPAKARELVNLVTFNSQKSKIGEQIHNPWKNPSYSKCEIYQGTEFSKEGKPEILSPSILRDYFKQLKL